MKPNVKDRALTAGSVLRTGGFSISTKNQAHLMVVLRDTLYSDKILAVIREYISNAWDAMRDAGKGGLPISVHLPTMEEPTFTVTDNGPGLCDDDIFNVFASFGESTKRSSDETVGMLGIGSKSGFSYADSFTITSRHGGWKRVYVAVLNDTDEGQINLLHEEEWDPEDTGLAIDISVKSEDIESFIEKGKFMLRHVRPQPVCNVEFENGYAKRDALPGGYLIPNSDVRVHEGEIQGWVGVMGCVPYRINPTQIPSLGKYAMSMSGVVDFGIGEVEINASREELKYSDSTKSAILNAITELVDSFVLREISVIEKTVTNGWDRRLRTLTFRQLHLPVPEGVKLYAEVVPLNDVKGFSFSHRPYRENKTWKFPEAKTLSVRRGMRLVLKDAQHPTSFIYDHSDVIVSLNPGTEGFSWKDLDARLKEMSLDGIPIVKMSSLTRRVVEMDKTTNPKHKESVFVLREHPHSGGSAESDNWEKVEHGREPQSDEIFVVLSRFVSNRGEPVVDLHKRNSRILDMFGLKHPKIYGYKTTDKKPINWRDLPGTHYVDWSAALPFFLMNSNVERLLDMRYAGSRVSYLPRFHKEACEEISEALGPDHDISRLVKNVIESFKFDQRMGTTFRRALDNLNSALPYQHQTSSCGETALIIDRVVEKYPLLGGEPGDLITKLLDPEFLHALRYVWLVDNN